MKPIVPPVILASTSVYRQELLKKLGLSFKSKAPLFDEDRFKNKGLSPLELAKTLAKGKASSLATSENCVIGGDQLVSFDGKILGKSKTKEKAIEQLLNLQGKTHELITAVCVFHKMEITEWVNITHLKMRPLALQQIESYIERDQPLDCAGSYKIEQNGLSLFEKIETSDFSAIQGLPLLELGTVLSNYGYQIPGVR